MPQAWTLVLDHWDPGLPTPRASRSLERSAFFLIWPGLVCPDRELERYGPWHRNQVILKSADQEVILSNEETQLLKW